VCVCVCVCVCVSVFFLIFCNEVYVQISILQNQSLKVPIRNIHLNNEQSLRYPDTELIKGRTMDESLYILEFQQMMY
jgi:hypothetical protein